MEKRNYKLSKAKEKSIASGTNYEELSLLREYNLLLHTIYCSLTFETGTKYEMNHEKHRSSKTKPRTFQILRR